LIPMQLPFKREVIEMSSSLTLKELSNWSRGIEMESEEE